MFTQRVEQLIHIQGLGHDQICTCRVKPFGVVAHNGGGEADVGDRCASAAR
jgi:hypothetical protein